MDSIKSAFESSKLKKGLDYMKSNGIGGVMSNARYKMAGPGLAYNGWYKEKHEADAEELKRQSASVFPVMPKISVIVPVYLTPELYLRAMLESVKKQSYANWELLLMDGSQAKFGSMPAEKTSAYDFVYSIETEQLMREMSDEDERIKYYSMKKNEGISGSYEIALTYATGDYVAFLNHDDMLSEDALYEIVKAINEGDYDFIYSDEDRCSSDGSRFSDPSFKPDFSLDLIRAYNYFGHLVAVKKSLAVKVSFRREFEGVEDYDFNLRCIEACVGGFPENPLAVMANRTLGRIKEVSIKPLDTSRIKHIPRVLYHSRTKTKSLAESGHKKDVSGNLARKAITQHLARTVGYATAVMTEHKGINKVQYETPGNPKVSVIIQGGKDLALMEKCIGPLFEKMRYSDFEIIIIDTVGEENAAVAAFYRIYETKRKNIHVINEGNVKNLAELRNLGASKANGEFLLFLDNNVELLDFTSMGEMVGNCLRDEVGIVGGTLYNDNGKIYKQGIILGVNGVAAYPNRGIRRGEQGYLMNNCISVNCLAVPAACMLVKTVVFDKAKGFDTRLSGDAAAIDLCLRAVSHGMLIVLAADAGWTYHNRIHSEHERIDEQSEKLLKSRWGEYLDKPDPYYNVNFSRNGTLFSL